MGFSHSVITATKLHSVCFFLNLFHLTLEIKSKECFPSVASPALSPAWHRSLSCDPCVPAGISIISKPSGLDVCMIHLLALQKEEFCPSVPCGFTLHTPPHPPPWWQHLCSLPLLLLARDFQLVIPSCVLHCGMDVSVDSILSFSLHKLH